MTRLSVLTKVDAPEGKNTAHFAEDLYGIDGVQDGELISSPNVGILTVDPTNIHTVMEEVKRLSQGCLKVEVIVE